MLREVKGISFPFRIGGRGNVVMSGRNSTGEQQKLKENIMSILGTLEFERVMNPEVGMENLDFFFDDLNESTSTMARYKIIEKLQLFEPRIEVVDIVFQEVTLDNGQYGYTADITFKELGTNEVGTLGFTFGGVS